MSINNKNNKMKKLLILIVLLTSFGSQAQNFARQSLGMNVGTNLYSDKLGNSDYGFLTGVDYRYMFTQDFGLVGSWQFDTITNETDHKLCEYAAVSHNFRIEMFKRLVSLGRFTVNGTAGLGTTFYYMKEDARARVFNYTAAANILYSLGNKKSPWGALKAEYRGIANTDQDFTLNNNFRTSSNPIQAFKQDLSLGFLVYLDRKANKPHADWSKKETKLAECIECKDGDIIQPIVINPTTIKKEMVIPYEVVLFEENSYEINTDAQRSAIVKMAEFIDKYEDMKMEIVASSCAGHGTPEYNFDLSVKRAKAVYEEVASLRGDDYSRLSYRGTGEDKRYRHKNQAYQKRVNFVIYK